MSSSSSDDESFLALVNLINVNNANNKKRRYWVHQYWKKNQKIKRSVFDVFKDLHTYPERFQSFYRMNTNTFSLLLQKVGPSIRKQDTNFRDFVSPEERLLITLR